ncbi:MAG TPA: RNA polymerase sigma factor, partial [Candidatus Mediterraneibacter intestinavium]|nr:RNA polymerase sigma factor [Candidatus Mediterraneibacter intestinavium]
MSDQELDLIRRLKRRDQKALEEIIRLFNQYVAAIICRILYGLADQSDIQALINHVFFLLWENADHIDTAKGDSLK